MHALRDAHVPSDPRGGPSATDGKDWLPGVHARHSSTSPEEASATGRPASGPLLGRRSTARVQPLVPGRGQALFDQLPDSRHLELVEATPFPSGILVQVYRPKHT